MLQNGLEPWHLLVMAILAIVMLGSKKLPDTARALGRSMRILKSEARALKADGPASGSAGEGTSQVSGGSRPDLWSAGPSPLPPSLLPTGGSPPSIGKIIPMAASEPTILATSGGHRAGGRTMVAFDALVHHAVDLSGVHGRRPRVLYVGTAIGDAEHFTARMGEAARVAGFDLTPLQLFPMPNLDDVEGTVLEQDVVWVMGGSVANLLAVWRVHGLDRIMRRAWEAGVVLSGVSAGSLCWFRGGTTDSFGPELRPLTDALGFLPYGNGVHYDSDAGRRPLVHRLVADGTLPTTHCTDDGVGLVYRGTELVEAVAELPGRGAYVVRCEGDSAVEERIEPRRLPSPPS